jgi:glutamyl-Q tRNA(Asp) synthetase
MAHALDLNQAPALLAQAIRALNQPAVELDHPEQMLQQAIAQWDVSLIPHCTTLHGTYV